jgi:hypothetical protein
MAMTDHRSIATVMGYFQAGSRLTSNATLLLSPPKDTKSENQNSSGDD